MFHTRRRLIRAGALQLRPLFITRSPTFASANEAYSQHTTLRYYVLVVILAIMSAMFIIDAPSPHWLFASHYAADIIAIYRAAVADTLSTLPLISPLCHA